MSESNDDARLARVASALPNEGASVDEQLQAIDKLLKLNGGSRELVIRDLLRTMARLRRDTKEIHKHVEGLREVVNKLTAPPLVRAIYRGLINTGRRQLAEVQHNGTVRLVEIGEELNRTELSLGDEVFLNHEHNIILAKSPGGPPRVGESAAVKGWASDSRLVITDRDTDVVVLVADSVRDAQLKPGDIVRWDRQAMIVLEKLEPAEDTADGIFEQIGSITCAQLAGHDALRDRAITRFVLSITNPSLAERYAIKTNNRLLLTGPPGCGKTTLMRDIAAAISRSSGRECRVAIINGAELYSPYVGQTEANIKRQINTLSDYDGPSVLFLDEIDAIGRQRGAAGNPHSDRFLGTLLAELEGMKKNGTSLVVIAATNRADMLDPALRERFAWEVVMPRPNLAAARAIFRVHLPQDLPYRPNGSAAASAREALIEAAVDQLYAPNAQNEIAVLRFRDGKTRTVVARELMSGRLIEQVCVSARESAFQRHADTGESGITLSDINAAVAETIDRLAATLTIRNAPSYLSDISQDIDLIAVEPVQRKVRRTHYVQ